MKGDDPHPLDWYDPHYFNNVMTLAERYDVVKDGVVIALPPIEYCTQDRWEDWRGLSRKDFMKKFGKAEKRKYNLPTEEDIELLEAYADGEARLSDYDSDEDEDEDADAEEAEVGDGGNGDEAQADGAGDAQGDQMDTSNN